MLCSIFRVTFFQGDGLFQRAQPSPVADTLGAYYYSFTIAGHNIACFSKKQCRLKFRQNGEAHLLDLQSANRNHHRSATVTSSDAKII